MDTERDLLLAALALRANLIDPDQLTRACQRWSGRQSSPLTALLLERGWITEADKSHLDYLLERNLARHDDNRRAALGALADAPLRQTLAGVSNPELQHWLAEVLTGPLWSESDGGGKRTLGALTLVIGLLIFVIAVGGIVTLIGGSLFVTRQRVVAQAQMQAERAALAAAAARQEALAQRRLAEANLQKARRAVDAQLTRVAEKERAAQPPEQALRQKLLEEALQFYSQLLKDKGADPRVGQQTGRAYQQLADSYRATKKLQEAEDAYRKAIDLQARLVADHPAAADYRHDLARSYQELANLQQALNRPEDAAKTLRAKAELEQLPKK